MAAYQREKSSKGVANQSEIICTLLNKHLRHTVSLTPKETVDFHKYCCMDSRIRYEYEYSLGLMTVIL